MNGSLAHFESDEYNAAIKVVEVLKDNGHLAYLAGGCVRDLLLGEAPKDFDVATDARPEQIDAYFRRTASVGAAFGVMLVRDFGQTIEVATFRSDGVYSDARRPDSIEFSSPEEDAQRRDFTINALFVDPLADDEAHQIIDFVDGVVDVHDRVLRAVGDPEDRLREDHLRALRAVRFAARYELEIEQRTKDAIRMHTRQLSGVSIERIGQEVRKMLLHPSRTRACVLIDELGLDDAIFGDVHPFDPSTMESLPETVSYPLALVALAIGRGFRIGDDADAACRRFRTALDLSNADRDAMRSIFDCLACFAARWDGLSESQRKRLVARERAEEALVILDALDRGKSAAIRSQIGQLAGRFGGIAPKALVTGADLIELGIAPGPAYKAILEAVYDEQLEGRIQTQPQAIAFVKETVKQSENQKNMNR